MSVKPNPDFLAALKEGKVSLPSLPAKKGEAAKAAPAPLKAEESPHPLVEAPPSTKEASASSPPPPKKQKGKGSVSPKIEAPILPISSSPSADAAPISEIIQHAALDSLFFCKQFFPKTFRQESPPFHAAIWRLLDDPSKRYINIQVQRDGAKTTLLRAYTAKRIAYGLSRTILYIGASQTKAINSVSWIKKAVEFNATYASTFGLRKGKPWTDEKAEIQHAAEGHSVTILGFGITGSVRGINIDDYRPDLIIIDDVVGDDNSATSEQRHKIVDLVLGAIKESLSPASETPDAKMIILNTPRDFEDLSQKALLDTQFASARFGCWTAETEDLPLEFQESAWPERYPSKVLREEKLAAIARNSLSIFAREKECKLVTPETSTFKAEWLRYFGKDEHEPEPPEHEMWIEYIIDPVPPPSQVAIEKGNAMRDSDFEAHTVMGRWKNNFYLLESIYNRGHDPSWSVATFFQLTSRWRPRKVIVETVAYQAALAWLLREGMKKTGRYFPILEFKDKRKKIYRISQGLKGPSSNGALFVRRTQEAFISQFIHYPGKNPAGQHDDVIETVAIGCESLSKGMVGEVDDISYQFSEKGIPELEYERGAP